MSAVVTFEGLDELMKAWKNEVDSFGGRAAVAVDRAAKAGAGVARAHAPRKKGDLDKSIDGRVTSHSTTGARGRIRAGANHASFMDEGTRPHEIRPKHAGALFFMKGSTPIFTQRVHHPGTRPYHFMRAAGVVAEQRLGAEMSAVADGVAERMNAA